MTIKIHQIFLPAHDWPKLIMRLNLLQLKLGIIWVAFPNFQGYHMFCKISEG